MKIGPDILRQLRQCGKKPVGECVKIATEIVLEIVGENKGATSPSSFLSCDIQDSGTLSPCVNQLREIVERYADIYILVISCAQQDLLRGIKHQNLTLESVVKLINIARVMVGCSYAHAHESSTPKAANMLFECITESRITEEDNSLSLIEKCKFTEIPTLDAKNMKPDQLPSFFKDEVSYSTRASYLTQRFWVDILEAFHLVMTSGSCFLEASLW